MMSSFGFAKKRELVGELAFGLGLRERGDQRRRRDEEDRVAGLDGGAAERDREVGLADARRTEEQHVLGAGDEAAGARARARASGRSTAGT